MRTRWLTLAGACLALAAPLAAGSEGRGPFAAEGTPARWAPDRDFDLEHLRAELRIDPSAGRVEGVARNRLRPLSRTLELLRLHAAQLEIESVEVDGVAADWRLEGQQLLVEPTAVLAAGEPVEVAVRYSAEPRRGLYFSGPDERRPQRPWTFYSQGEMQDNRYWLPTWDYPNDRASWELLVELPAGLELISNGRLVGVEQLDDGWRRWHWSLEPPHVSYLISVAGGELELWRDSWRDVELVYAAPRGRSREEVWRSLAETPDMLEFFSRWTGVAYPFPRYSQTLVQDFLWGGMENVGATTLGDRTLHDARAEPQSSSRNLVAHEAAHQWWGDMVTMGDWAHNWLNEGFATYFTGLYIEHALGRDEFLQQLDTWAESYRKEDSQKYRRPIVSYVHESAEDMFDSHAYPKGAWVLHMLRGWLGDADFKRALRHYLQRNRWGLVVTRDLIDAVIEATGRNPAPLLHPWLHMGGHPELKVVSSWDTETRQLRVEIEQQQQPDELTPIFRVPLMLEAVGDQGSLRRELWLEAASQQLDWPLPWRPRALRVDPDEVLLKTLEQPRTLETLTWEAEHHPNPIGRRRVAGGLLDHSDSEQARDTLRHLLLDDPFWGVRVGAAKTLAKADGPWAAPLLLAALDDHDPRVREAAAEALGTLQAAHSAQPEALAVLRRQAREERNWGARAAALGALGKARAPDALEELRRALRHDSYQDKLRKAALSGLAELGGRAAFELVLAWAEELHAEDAAGAAMEAAAKLGGRLGGEAREQARERAADGLESTSWRLRQAAVKALRKLADERARRLLERVADQDEDRRVVREAQYALRAIAATGGAQRSGEPPVEPRELP